MATTTSHGKQCDSFRLAGEPPVPAGMGALPKPLCVLADFYEISDDLLEAAAEESDSVNEPVAKPLPVQAWLEKKSEKQRLLLIGKLLAEERSDAGRRQEQDAQEKHRKTRLAAMAKHPGETVASISKLVSMKSVVKYSEAVALLCDLREALGPDLGPEFTALTAAELRKLFPRTNGLVAKLKEHGFL